MKGRPSKRSKEKRQLTIEVLEEEPLEKEPLEEEPLDPPLDSPLDPSAGMELFFAAEPEGETGQEEVEENIEEAEEKEEEKKEEGKAPFLNSLRSAFALFSVVPMGRVEPDRARYMLCFFPFVGLVLGGLMLGLSYLGQRLLMGDVFMGCALCVLGILFTGGIHLDGWMDVSDALSSWQGRERRLEILKDSHVGAFACIRLAALLLVQVGAYSDMWTDERAMSVMALSMVVSRCLSAVGVLLLPKARTEGMVASFSQESEQRLLRRIGGPLTNSPSGGP